MLLFCDPFCSQSEVSLKDLPPLEERHPLLSWEPVLDCLADQGLKPRVRGYIRQGGITCGAIDEPRKSSKAIDERVIINFRDKNVVIARFRDKNVYR